MTIRTGFAMLLGLAMFAATPATAACEMHVWVVKNAMARGLSGTVMAGGGVRVHARLNDDIGALLGSYLDRDYQYETLRAANLGQRLLPGATRMIYHPELAERALDPKTSPPLFESSATCYVEFAVIGQTYETTALSRMLYTSWLVRRFDGGRMTLNIFKAYATQVDAFPGAKPEDADAARADVRRAFATNLRRFLEDRKLQKLRR